MSILSGFIKTIKYRLTDDGYKWQSEKTSSHTVVMGDGTDDTDTLESRLGSVKGITSSLSSTDSSYALSASAGKSLQDQATTNANNINTLNTNLTKHKTSSDHDDRYYTEVEIDNKLSQKSKVTVQAKTLTGNGGNWILVSNSDKRLITAQTVRDDTSFYVTGINKQSATGVYTLIFNENIGKGSNLLVWLTWIE